MRACVDASVRFAAMSAGQPRPAYVGLDPSSQPGSVGEMVAHLAGALGRPVRLLNRFDTDWRWMRDRDDSPWYPTMRIIRQPAPGAWEPVITKVAGELAKWLAGRDG